MEPTRLVKLSGSPRERGRQHGQALAGAIASLYDRYMANAAEGKPPLIERDLLAYAMGHLPESRAYCPDLIEEIDGIAEGANLPFEKLWFLNCFDEAGAYQIHRSRAAGHACTTFAATGLSTTDGTTYLGQGWDMPEMWDSVILDIEPGEQEIGALVYTHAGIVGGSGINAAGLALVWATLIPTDLRQGVPSTLLVRKVLQQRNLAHAVGSAISGVRASGFNFIIGADFGAVSIEASATRQHLRYVGQHLGHANHYEELDMLPFDALVPQPALSTVVRSGRMNQLLDQKAGNIDLSMCQAILRDHAGYPCSICSHEQKPLSSGCTRSLLYVPAERLMLATNAEPCHSPYVEYRVAAAASD
jgi:isopenicillin-N N-acyltransferase like protein